MDPQVAGRILCESPSPFVIGVRHHSPALAAVMPALLDGYFPDVLLVELPSDLQDLIPFLSAPDCEAPVALFASASDEKLVFYPFADFSPELAALRWARARGIPVIACDAPVGGPVFGEEEDPGPAGNLEAALCNRLGLMEDSSSWESVVENHAWTASPGSVHRAALMLGWTLRMDSPGLDAETAWREACMRRALARQLEQGFSRPAMVLGAFHVPAVMHDPGADPWPRTDGVVSADPAALAVPEPVRPVTRALVPTDFTRFDARCGYEAGILDPRWRQLTWQARVEGLDPRQVAVSVVVEVAAALRGRKQPGSVPDVLAALQMALDLATLRGLAWPGREEIASACRSCMSHGAGFGQGRHIEEALLEVMVGDRRGRLPAGAPASGLLEHIRTTLSQLRLQDGLEAGRTVRLDPLRSELDRRRHLTLHRLRVCEIHLGEPADTTDDPLTHVWRLRWTPSVEAMAFVAQSGGITLRSAARSALLARSFRKVGDGAPPPEALLELVRDAADCGLGTLVEETLARMEPEFLPQASFAAVLSLLGFLERARLVVHPGLTAEAPEPADAPGSWEPCRTRYDELSRLALSSAVRHVEALAGSRNPDDLTALLQLIQLAKRQDLSRLRFVLGQLAVTGEPFMRGAAEASLWLCGACPIEPLGELIESVFGLADPRVRVDFWQGAFMMLEHHLSGTALLGPLQCRVRELPDPEFLRHLPALRTGFSILSRESRDDLFSQLARAAGFEVRSARLPVPDAWVTWIAEADVAGELALAEAGLATAAPEDFTGAVPIAERPVESTGHVYSEQDRWLLILGGEQPARMSAGALRLAHVLDPLETGQVGGGAGGSPFGAPFPTVRQWIDELDETFGTVLRNEILVRAASAGNLHAACELEPDTVVPSVELVCALLSLQGGLSEAQLGRLRRMVSRAVDEIVSELSRVVRPAFFGLQTPRPTRRPGGRLHLDRTILANLHTARMEPRPVVFPERPVFLSRARRQLDWHLILLVDVSGSMEASVVTSACMAAIFASLPALSVSFLAFSTEVADLTGLVSDPLQLLLEVSVGGGTDIGAGLAAARGLVRSPSRTMVVLVSDFEEGPGPGRMLAEIRRLVDSSVRCLGLAAISDAGQARYDVSGAQSCQDAGMQVAVMTPGQLARWIREVLS